MVSKDQESGSRLTGRFWFVIFWEIIVKISARAESSEGLARLHSLLPRCCTCGTSLVAQWLRLRVSAAGCEGSIPGQGTKILHAALRSQNNTMS